MFRAVTYSMKYSETSVTLKKGNVRRAVGRTVVTVGCQGMSFSSCTDDCVILEERLHLFARSPRLQKSHDDTSVIAL